MDQHVQGGVNSTSLSPFEGFDGQKILRRIIGIWPIILISIILSLLAGWIYLRYTAPLYLTKTSILIKEDKSRSTSLADNAILKELAAGSMTKTVDNEIELLKSFDMMEVVVRNLELYLTYKTVGRFTDRVSYRNYFPVVVKVADINNLNRPFTISVENTGVNSWAWKIDSSSQKPVPITFGKMEKYDNIHFAFEKLPDSLVVKSGASLNNYKDFSFKVDFTPLVSTVNYFTSKLKVEGITDNGSVIGIEIIDFNEERSVELLKELVKVYTEKNFIDKNEVNSNTVKFLDDRLKVFEKDLKDIESRVSTFKSQNKVNTVSGEAAQFLTQSGEIDMMKVNQKTQISVIEALENELIKNRNNPTLVPSTMGISEPSLGVMIQKHNSLVLERERLKDLAGPKNPLLADINGQIQSLRESMITNLASLKSAYTKELNSLVNKDNELSKSLLNVPEVERNLLEITRDKNVREQLYFFLLQKRAESAIALASSVMDSRVVEAPREMGMVSPREKPVWLIVFFVGFFIPIIYTLLKDALDNTVGDKVELGQSCMAPLLGEISYITNLKKKIIISDGDRSVVSEQFRTIRTQLEFTSKGKSLKKILVTSHRPGEGKSFTSLNLAASYTLLSKKVLILEFDLRKPRLAKYLELGKGKGISSYLSGKAQLNEILQEVPGFNGNFFIISAGPIPPNPAELINGSLMESFMKEIEQVFDVIILDTPPFGIVADPMLLEKYADISIVVLRQGFSLKMVYNEVNSRIASKNDPPMYTILNGVGMQKKYAYGYENYMYGYGYYSDDASKKRFSLMKIIRMFRV